MNKFATSLTTILKRSTNSIVDEIAQDGLVILRDVLKSSGFTRSPYLKNYEIFSHVRRNEITFEIVIDVSALEMKEEKAQKIVEESKKEEISESARTYGIGLHGTNRILNRTKYRPIGGAYDARSRARDIRRTSTDRNTLHEASMHAPRSIEVTREGKLSVLFKKSMRETKSEIHFPKGKLQGLLGRFIDELAEMIAKKFTPALEEAIKNYSL